MAVDPKHDDDRDDDVDDDDERGPTRRVPKVLTSQKSLPSVESALDDFIVRANQRLLDVSEFTPEAREQGLRDEIEDLKKRLAAAEARAELVEAENAPAKRSWGAIAGAFVVGCASVFAVNLVMRSDDKRESPAAVAPATPASDSTPQAGATDEPAATAPGTADTAAAVDTAAVDTAAVDTAPQPPTAPGSDPMPIDAAPQPATAQTPAKPSRIARTPAKPKPPKQSTPRRPPPAGKGSGEGTTNTTKPPPADKGSGEGDLYNPF